ncbi:hypothetical protein MASR2M48_20050 [Spirochaetota bacterium]
MSPSAVWLSAFRSWDNLPIPLEPSATTRILALRPLEPAAYDLLVASLHFSGAGEARSQAAMRVGLEAIAAAAELLETVSDPYERGARVLALVHGVIKRYDLLESRMDNALLEGRFNCVGSSSLYAILARAAGLSPKGVILSDHAYCYLSLDGRRIDVETTSAGGYDLPAGKRPSGPSSEVSIRGILALALSNRATLLERSGRWPEALALAVDAFAYAPDDLTRDRLEGRIHNAVAALIRDRRYDEAQSLAEEALSRYGPSPTIASSRDAARLASLTEALRASAPLDALAIADTVAGSGFADAEWLERAYAFAYAGIAEDRRKSGDHLGAWQILAEATMRIKGSESLLSLERVARTNWLRSEHNRFVELYNAGRYGDALDSVRRALKIAPGERLLSDDSIAAEAALSATMPRVIH